MPVTEAFHVTRTLRAMELLSMSEVGLSAPELGEALTVHVRTSRRVLRRLEDEGYVYLAPGRRRRYRPTMRAVALAGQILERAELPRLAVPHVESLREQLDVSAHLCVPSHVHALCVVHDAVGPCACRPQFRELVPAHCTAAGKALLAWRPAWCDEVLKRELGRFTDRTLTEPGMVRRELRFTRARGYAYEDREFQATRGFGAPVRAERGEALAALCVVGPVESFSSERHSEIGTVVVETAAALSRELGLEAMEKARQ
jgi:DNA-binding IclR family transcriptional regulator